MPRVTDPWFESQFYGRVTETGFRELGSSIDGAQGLLLWCPCGYGKPEWPLDGPRPHMLLVPFANPRNAPALPASHGPLSRDGTHHPRWTMSGDSLDTLTLQPSIDAGEPSCWHGFITNGEVKP